MPLTNVSNDAAAKTVTLIAEFDAPVERAWQLYADPRQLEQWWNPPGFPLTITDHDLSVGGMVRAHVTTPDGQKIHAYWRITAVDAPRSMEWEDGFLDDNLEPNPDMPLSTMRPDARRPGRGRHAHDDRRGLPIGRGHAGVLGHAHRGANADNGRPGRRAAQVSTPLG